MSMGQVGRIKSISTSCDYLLKHRGGTPQPRIPHACHPNQGNGRGHRPGRVVLALQMAALVRNGEVRLLAALE